MRDRRRRSARLEQRVGALCLVALPSLLAVRFALPPKDSLARGAPAHLPPDAAAPPSKATLLPAIQAPRALPIDDPPAPRIVCNSHIEKNGQKLEYEEIGLRPERSADYREYRYPLATTNVVSGYDLDAPNAKQRRGSMRMVGHGGIDLTASKGTPITMIALEHQIGDAEVLYAGWLYGESIVTRHTLREAGGEHDYLMIFAHLQRAANGVRRGTILREGAIVGYVGDTASAGFAHLHLEVRRVRDAIDPWAVLGWELHARDVSIVTDPRNVLPLRE